MKNTNATTARKRKGDRTNSTRGDGEIWVFDIRSNGTKGGGERSDKCSRGKGGKNRDVYNGVFGGDVKEKSKGGI